MSKRVNFKGLLVVLLIGYSCYTFINQQIIMNKIKVETNTLQQEAAKLQEKNEKLQDEVKMSKTDLYAEKLAREKLKLIKENETPVINNK